MKADSKWLKKHDRMSVWSKLIEIDKMKAVYYELHVKFFILQWNIKTECSKSSEDQNRKLEWKIRMLF